MTVNPASGDKAPLPAHLASAAQQIDDELKRRSTQPMTLSPQAAAKLEIWHAEYLGHLGQEAVRSARRVGLSTVDETHVDDAAKSLGASSKSGTASNVANTLGGVFAGAGIAALYAISYSPGPHTVSEMITAIVLLSLGATLLGVGVTLLIANRRR